MYCHHHHHPPLVVGPVEIVEIVLVESCRLLGVEEPLWLTARATAGASADILEKLEVGVLHGDGEERKGRKWNEINQIWFKQTPEPALIALTDDGEVPLFAHFNKNHSSKKSFNRKIHLIVFLDWPGLMRVSRIWVLELVLQVIVGEGVVRWGWWWDIQPLLTATTCNRPTISA